MAQRARGRRILALSFAGIALAVLGTAALRAPRHPAQPPATAISAEFSGCAAVTRSLACALGPERRMYVWVPEPWLDGVRWFVDGQPLEPAAQLPVSRGTRFQLSLPSGARELLLRASHAGTAGTWRLAFEERRQAPAVARAQQQKQAGELTAARRTLENEPGLARADRAEALGILGRVALAEGRVDDAIDHLKRASEADKDSLWLSDEVKDALALAFIYTQRVYRFEDARAVLDRVRPLASSYPDGRAEWPYYAGLLHSELGELRRALIELERAAEASRRLGLEYAERIALDRIAGTLHALGRDGEAVAKLRSLAATHAAHLPACEQVDIRNNLGWFLLEAAGDRRAEARQALADARSQFSRCADPFKKTHVLTNLALLAIRDANALAARAHLAEARATLGAHSELFGIWWSIVDGDASLLEGRARDALRAFDAAFEGARRASVTEPAWRAAIGRGKALEALGQLAAAERAYEAAEDLLDGLNPELPFGEGRAAFLALHTESTQRLLELLVTRRKGSAALALLEHACARQFLAVLVAARFSLQGARARAELQELLGRYRRLLGARERAAATERELPADELLAARRDRTSAEQQLRLELEQRIAELQRAEPAPRAEHPPAPSPHAGGPTAGVTLAFHRLRGGWAAFVRDSSGNVTVTPLAIDAEAPAKNAPELLAPLAPHLRDASTVAILACGELAQRDLQALPLGGKLLGERFAVTHTLGLRGASRSSGSRSEHPPRVVVVGDPRHDLPSAAREAERVTTRYRALGGTSQLLVGAAATSSAVANELERADVFHFAGHARFSGVDGAHSHLALAAGSELTVSDVLALSSVPATVVLSGCEAGRNVDARRVESFGLAHAFVLAGAELVIAPTHAVSDQNAGALGEAFASAFASGKRGPYALAAALRELRAARPHAEWAAFRALTP